MPSPFKYKIVLLFYPCFLSFTANAENTWVTVKPSYRQVTITGFSRARHSMILSTEVDGKVEQVFADVGDAVPDHGNVACLDKTFVKNDINSVKNEVAQHQNDVRYYSKQVERYQALVGKQSAAISQLDEFQRQLGNSRRMAQIKRLERQRFEEKQIRHCIKSPVGWRVVERYVEPGQWLDVGVEVAKVADYSKLLVPLALSVREMTALQKNQDELKVKLSEYAQQVTATIERISPAFDDETRKIQVDLLLQENLPIYRGGLRVEVKLDLPDPAGTFLISEKALDKRYEEVWAERKGGESLRVDWLGNAIKGQVRIASPEITAGDQFKILQP
ncbi:MAG: efflux RND transporter periplasmic adaptor subunit [Methylococcaceae bacterium]